MRISATSFDNFQRYLDDLMTKDELIQRITAPFEPTREMQIGTAIHSFIEKPVYQIDGLYIIDDFKFSDLNILLQNLSNYLDGFQEIKIQTKNNNVNLITKLDLWFGNTIVEHKTTFKQFETEKYINSWQWKLYLFATNAKLFKYNIIGLQEKDGIIGIKYNEMFDLYPYEKLAYDCENIISEFAKFITDNDLLNYFKDK